jgi:hypothetical protein
MLYAFKITIMKEDELKKRIEALIDKGWTFYGQFETGKAVESVMEFLRYNSDIIKE